MTPRLQQIEEELSRFQPSVREEFRRAVGVISPDLSEMELLDWAQHGLDIAQQSVRSWETASEYYRATPQVKPHLNPSQLLDWGRSGAALCLDSPTLGSAFFRASTKSAGRLNPAYVQEWANLGRGLYRGTWKSGALAAKFFEVSSEMLEYMTFQELSKFAQLINSLSQKSTEVAADCLVLGQQVLPQFGDGMMSLINLSQVVAESNWREVKSSFESASKIVAPLHEKHRGRFLDISAAMVRGGISNISLFINETVGPMSRVDGAGQSRLLGMAEVLLPMSHDAVAAFLKSAPELLERMNQDQLRAWFDRGVTILSENPDGGLAYFKVESNTSEAVLESLSTAIELGKVKGLLGMYCRALAGAGVEIAPARELLSKNIGWVSEDHATTEGSVVYLPGEMDKYDTKERNFSLFKVVCTHQVAHIEFGSFDFLFERPSVLFADSRLKRAEQTNGKEAPSPMQQPLIGEDSVRVERAFRTDMERFFNLFDNRRLALDIFTVVEDGRLDHRIRSEYPGLAPAYTQVQQDALLDRPEIEEMPLQEAMVEFLVRLSLQQSKGLPAPKQYLDNAKATAKIFRRLLVKDASVEDSTEATIRIYDLIAEMPNVELPEEEWTELDIEDNDMTDEELESILEEIQSPDETSPPNDMQTGNEEEYDSPSQVDYRGDFKPELSQLLSALRMQQGQTQGQEGVSNLSKEELEQLLANSAELDMVESSEEASPEQLGALIQNIVQEIGSGQTPDSGKGQGMIPHVDEEGYPIEVGEPQTYLYDEWDFRADDYKPRWCVVREKWVPEGDSQFFTDTLRTHSSLASRIRRQFEMLAPEVYRKTKHLPDGEDFDLDAVIESIIDKWAGESPSDKVHWRRNKVERDVSVVFLLDMSASTAESIDDTRRDSWDAPDDPVEYMAWLRSRRLEGHKRSYKRIIDLEKEGLVLLINALETIGDVYGIYGFSGYGRENVEFYTIKDIEEKLSERVKKRIDRVTPLHATRMGPAIRHAVTKLDKQGSRTKLLFLISDGRPQDRGYSREGVEKEYAVHDTKMALTEARRKNITPFCLTVDKAGHDYLATMCQDMGYEVLDDINSLPARLPTLYRKLTV